MALTTCKECGKEKISDQADTCPSCGFSFEKEREKEQKEQKERKEKEARAKSTRRKIVLGILGGILTVCYITAYLSSLGDCRVCGGTGQYRVGVGARHDCDKCGGDGWISK